MSLMWNEWASSYFFFFFSSRRRHTRLQGDWSSDVCSSDLLMHTGGVFQTSANGLLTTAAAQPTAAPAYALEGSVFVGGAVVQWLRDGLRAIEHSGQVQQLAESVPDSGGVMMVPAFTGLGAPYWKPDARGTITGLTRGTTIADRKSVV